jgi:hypothetical protein
VRPGGDEAVVSRIPNLRKIIFSEFPYRVHKLVMKISYLCSTSLSSASDCGAGVDHPDCVAPGQERQARPTRTEWKTYRAAGE